MNKLKVGDCIRKTNNQIFGRDHDMAAAIEVKSMKTNNRGTVVNGLFNVRKGTVKTISSEEMDGLNEFYNSLTVSPNTNTAINTSHFREDNGMEKIGYKRAERALAILFHDLQKYPGKPLAVYLCDHCQHYHLGKIKPVHT